MTEREEAIWNFVDRARKAVKEIDQIFTDVAYWNENVRKPEQPPIDPDPDGQLEYEKQKWMRFIMENTKPCP